MSQILLSVPPSLSDFVATPAGRRRWIPRLAEGGSDSVFIGADPRARRLGSGGGTVALLAAAWRRESRRRPLADWLGQTQRLVLHAGGESRRLPAYAAVGKAFIPMPPIAGLAPRRHDQVLADFQVPEYRQVLEEAGPAAAVLVTSGDVWLDFDPLQIPRVTADIAGIGMRVSAEVASHFGVFFVDQENVSAGREATTERPIAFFLQKPSAAEIYRRTARCDFYVDTGMWLLSAKAVAFLFRRCGWDESAGRFDTPDGHPAHLDLYTEIGSALGREAALPAPLRRLGFHELSSAVIGLDQARFYHLGSNRQLFESFEQMQHGQLVRQRSLVVASPAGIVKAERTSSVWVDGLATEQPLTLAGDNLAVGLPRGAAILRLEPGWSVEAAPVGASDYVLRPFHVDDTLRGAAGGPGKICGRPARAWLEARGLWSAAAAKTDVFDLALYPVVPAAALTQDRLDWFFAARPEAALTGPWRAARRLSAAEIPGAVDFARLFRERDRLHAQALREQFLAVLERGSRTVFDQDFAALAAFVRQRAPALGRWLRAQAPALLRRISRPEHASRFQLLLAALSHGTQRQAHRAEGYRRLQAAVVAANRWEGASPTAALKDDQIVWARSPVRLDLAGGWTDTPPYCFEYGGAVLNVAVLLNGQPPIQVFVRPLAEPLFRLKSIDLGSQEEIATFAQLATFRDPRSGFSLPKAALSLAGFHPDFAAGGKGRPRSLGGQLQRFGGGLEISLLSAVPKGSGLGTSSILGATLLAALNRACALGWDEVDLYRRVLGVEQLLTTGGGWQDQAGALFRGVKLIATQPGWSQTPSVRFLPEHLLGGDHANHTLLLYYTGVTRLAQGILKEIVHDMFLGRCSTLRTLALLRANADHLHRALQEGSQAALHRCIARSWRLNRQLDPGTSTPAIDGIIERAGPDLAACKLLGAGGGGYLLLCARTAEGGRRIRERLESRPPNRRARFIAFEVAGRAVEVTVS